MISFGVDIGGTQTRVGRFADLAQPAFDQLARYRERARVPLPSGMGVNGAVAAATMYLLHDMYACHVV